MATASITVSSTPHNANAETGRSQKKLEIRLSKKYRGKVGLRIVFEVVCGIGAWLGVIALATSGTLPYWIACLANGWIAYLMYVPLHEGTHGNIGGANTRMRWLDHVCGHISAVTLWYSFAAHKISHVQHHAHVNHPKRDPDYFLAGPLWSLIPKNGILAVLQTMVPVMALCPKSFNLLPRRIRTIARISRVRRSPEEVAHDDRFIRLCVAVFLLLSLSGYFVEALVLWWLPSRIGMGFMTFLFAWLPHFPHADRSRYRNARITLFPGSSLMLRNQDRHLLHHMFPRVPHYRLPALFNEMRPHLEAHGARIEGPLAGPGAPKIGMRLDPATVGDREGLNQA